MPISRSNKPTREWLLLVVAFILVAIVCVPLWQWSGQSETQAIFWSKWTPERLGRLLLGPEQIACYICTIWAGFIIFSRYLEVQRQRQAFELDLLPTDEGARILPEDARPLLRKVDVNTAHRGPLILATMVRMALGKYAISRSAPDVGEVVRTQAEVEQFGRVGHLTSLGGACGPPTTGFSPRGFGQQPTAHRSGAAISPPTATRGTSSPRSVAARSRSSSMMVPRTGSDIARSS